jgi:hypothetical protein
VAVELQPLAAAVRIKLVAAAPQVAPGPLAVVVVVVAQRTEPVDDCT